MPKHKKNLPSFGSWIGNAQTKNDLPLFGSWIGNAQTKKYFPSFGFKKLAYWAFVIAERFDLAQKTDACCLELEMPKLKETFLWNKPIEPL